MKFSALLLVSSLAFVGSAQNHESFFDDVGNFFNRAADKITTVLPDVKDKVQQKLSQISDTVPEKIQGGIDHVGQKVFGAKQKIEQKLQPLSVNMPIFSQDQKGNLQVTQPYSVQPQTAENSNSGPVQGTPVHQVGMESLVSGINEHKEAKSPNLKREDQEEESQQIISVPVKKHHKKSHKKQSHKKHH